MIDPILYVALASGFVAGRLVHKRGRWLNIASQVTIIVLVFFLGAEFGPTAGLAALWAVPLAFALALLTLGLTLAVLVVLPYRPIISAAPVPSDKPPIPFGAILVIALLAGLGAGRVTSFPSGLWLEWTLYILLVLVGFDLHLSRASLTNTWAPLTAAVVGATAAGLVWGLTTGTSLPVSLATTLGFGFYTLSGPLVAVHAGAFLGLLAFLSNFLRENLTMILAPSIGPRVRSEGLTAIGGATSMDTTLYFVVHHGDPEGGSMAIACGLILTVAASVLVPALLALSGA